MRHHKALTVSALAAVLLGALVGTASAGRLSLSSQTIRMTWASLTFSGGFGTVRCAVTMEGSFHSRTIAKTRESLIGYITNARISHPCSAGAAWAHSGETNEVLGGTVSNRLPWHIRYASFTGTLPNITSMNVEVVGIAYLIREPVFGVLCEYAGGAEGRGGLLWRIEFWPILAVTYAATETVSTNGCPNLTTNGTGRVTVLNSSTGITLTLI
jgi:hypothetical protein